MWSVRILMDYTSAADYLNKVLELCDASNLCKCFAWEDQREIQCNKCVIIMSCNIMIDKISL